MEIWGVNRGRVRWEEVGKHQRKCWFPKSSSLLCVCCCLAVFERPRNIQILKFRHPTPGGGPESGAGCVRWGGRKEESRESNEKKSNRGWTFSMADTDKKTTTKQQKRNIESKGAKTVKTLSTWQREDRKHPRRSEKEKKEEDEGGLQRDGFGKTQQWRMRLSMRDDSERSDDRFRYTEGRQAAGSQIGHTHTNIHTPTHTQIRFPSGQTLYDPSFSRQLIKDRIMCNVSLRFSSETKNNPAKFYWEQRLSLRHLLPWQMLPIRLLFGE